jgi:hypothetical protein
MWLSPPCCCMTFLMFRFLRFYLSAVPSLPPCYFLRTQAYTVFFWSSSLLQSLCWFPTYYIENNQSAPNVMLGWVPGDACALGPIVSWQNHLPVEPRGAFALSCHLVIPGRDDQGFPIANDLPCNRRHTDWVPRAVPGDSQTSGRSLSPRRVLRVTLNLES